MRTSGIGLFGALALAMLAGSAAADDDWYPSRYGADDTLGAANELSAEGVLAAAKLVTRGRTYALGVPTGRDTPGFGARSFQLYVVPHGDGTGAPLGTNEATFNDDWMLAWLGVGTQIDGLAHFGIGHRYYNGRPVQEFFRPTGVTVYGTHTLPPIVTRGVLLDVARHRGVERLAAGDVVSAEEIRAIEQAQGTPVERGDVVILHTGWQALAASEPEAFLAGEPGIVAEGARYLTSKRVVAVGSDTWGLDVLPHPDADPEHPNAGPVFPAHQELLAKTGTYILENLDTARLARDLAEEGHAPFLFVLGQPRFVGAVQMVVNPVAIR